MEDTIYLEEIVKGIVEFPEAVVTTRKTDDMGVLITLDVDRRDMGKVIGREGNTAKALRTILKVFGMRNNSRLNLKINDPQKNEASDF